LVALFACGGSNVIGPDNELEVASTADTFQWQVSDLDDVTQIVMYGWPMTGTVATVNQSSALAGGSATLTIQDASGWPHRAPGTPVVPGVACDVVDTSPGTGHLSCCLPPESTGSGTRRGRPNAYRKTP
ncbi:MAG TPA: hypothetical protein QGF05_03845, partial [Dehalococcoidia bacterium]|nr:hypothetical protein [Dehalococcoidia bacterium]